MPETLPPIIVSAGERGRLDTDAHRVLYVSQCGSLAFHHSLINRDGGLRITMLIVDRDRDAEISPICISEPISEEQAFFLVERWAVMQEFEQSLGLAGPPGPRP